jgi:hypothetical protein
LPHIKAATTDNSTASATSWGEVISPS